MNRKPVLDRAVTILNQARKATAPRPGVPAPAAQIKLTDKTIYLACRVDGMSGINQLLDSNTKRLVGVTNFDGNQLSAGRDMVVDGVRVMFTSTGAQVEAANWQQTKALDPVLLNSEFRLKQKDNVLIDLPVTDAVNFINDDFRDIATTPLLKALEEINLELETPKNVAIAAGANLYARFEFRVTQAKR